MQVREEKSGRPLPHVSIRDSLHDDAILSDNSLVGLHWHFSPKRLSGSQPLYVH
jgi:hypothetical protein